MKTIAIIPAAGSGKRLGAKDKKPFVLLGGKPLVSYALRALDSSPDIDGIIVACEAAYINRIRTIARRCRVRKLIDVIVGGKTRFESIRNCVRRVGPSAELVLVHDAARPFIDGKIISRSVKAAQKFGASIAAVPESDTVKFVDGRGFIRKTLDRNRVFRAQTPQVFKRSIIERAYSARRSEAATDDARLVEERIRVKIVAGSYKNLKITTKEDLKIARALL
ncbi:MAG: 2-C-methyl-D-erythritol 4-phosphate cytidylyltransferase [Candidatus Omnitrophota bacterium]